MAARSWLLLLCLAAAAPCGVLKARAQPDSIGFISIDCGMPGTASSVDENRVGKLRRSWEPLGSCGVMYSDEMLWLEPASVKAASGAYASLVASSTLLAVPGMPQSMLMKPARIPDADGARSCYTLRSLNAGLKYLVRAFFMYGDYDGLRRPPVFEVYVGVNFLSTVNVSDPGVPELLEAIVVVPDSFLQLCLVNTGAGTPFVSALELRPLKATLYPQANATHGLALVGRANFGPTNDSYAAIVRYPDDPHDRLWFPSVDAANWTVVSTTSWVQNIHGDLFGEPSKVMQTAVTPRNASGNIELFWEPRPVPKDPSLGYVAVMHFSELQEPPPHGGAGGAGVRRQFYININGRNVDTFTTTLLYAEAAYVFIPIGMVGYTRYNVSLNATANSTLPPMINAMEVFSLFPTTNVGTDSIDVSAITAIKDGYNVRKNWMGDPCFPKALAWDRLACSYAVSSPPRITNLNLSFSALNGDISSSFANLKAVQYLDLSNNNLTGSIPDALSKLPSLILLDLTGNQLSGSIPTGLLKRIQDGSLNLKYGNNPRLCTDGNSCQALKRKSKLTAVYIAIPVALAVVAVLLLLLCFIIRRIKHGSVSSRSAKPWIEPINNAHADDHSSLQVQQRNRQFTYKELQVITKNFQTVLGKGGFGDVYEGFLEDRTQVAVKLRRSQTTSDRSDQGVKQFLAEVEILTRIHHRNLVSMVGYCKDGEHLGLVYEYMPLGTLQQHIAGKDGRYLTWRRRLQIAVESAQGLEYLHKSCSPPLIHRDVKSDNILLTARLEAKVADFGLSKAFNHDDTHVATATIAGTRGYLDPEYHATGKPTSKSDVYSFGVVLLELVAGRPADTTIVQWERQRLAQGNIEAVVDPRMRGDHDINGVWKVADVALKCTAQASAERPTMTGVVAQLQECLQLEHGRSGGGDMSDSSYTANSGAYAAGAGGRSIDGSLGSTSFEMERNYGRVPPSRMGSGPAAR